MMTTRAASFCSVACALLALTFAGDARANMAASQVDGDNAGLVLPKSSAHVRVAREELSFTLGDGLCQAAVAVRYRLENASEEPEKLAVAFARLIESPSRDGDKPAVVKIDGQQVIARTKTAPDAGDDPDGVRAAWGAVPPRGELSWLLFDIDVPARGARTVDINYRQVASEERAARVNPICGFDYLLSPAKHWAGFGALSISVTAPEDATLTSNLPLVPGSARTWKLEQSGLPGGELHFEIMSKRGVVLGIDSPDNYWTLLLTLASAANLAMAIALGRRFATNRTRLARLGRSLLTVAPLSLVITIGLTLLIGSFGARYPYGFGYGEVFFIFVGAPLIAVMAALISTLVPGKAQP
jgi:hypothetical protein